MRLSQSAIRLIMSKKNKLLACLLAVGLLGSTGSLTSCGGGSESTTT